MRPELEAQMKELMYKVGHESGRLEGLQRAALEIARARGVADPDIEERILATFDPDQLTRMVVALGTAASGDEARTALAAVATTLA